MKKRKLLVFLVCLCLALGTAVSVSAFAGINTNTPVGGGLIGGGTLNNDFTIRGDSEDASAYGYHYDNTIWEITEAGPINEVDCLQGIPVADVVDGSKFVMQFDVYDDGGSVDAAGTAKTHRFGPFVPELGRVDWTNDTMMGVIMQPSAGATIMHKPAGTGEFWLNGSKMEGTDATKNGFGFQTDLLTAQLNKGRQYVTYWLEFDITDKSMTIFAGYNDGETDVEKEQYGTIKNAFTLPTSTVNYSWLWRPAQGFQFDNYKLYRVNNGVTDKTYVNETFENESGLTIGVNVTGKLIVGDNSKYVGKFIPLNAYVRVTNPNENARIVSKAKLLMDAKVEPSFEMETSFRLESWAADSTRKVGLAFGLDSVNDPITAQDGGAKFIYLTVEEGKVMLGAEKIASDGTATACGERVEVEGATAGAEAGWIKLNLTGKSDKSVQVKVGEQTVSFTGLDMDGSGLVAIAQTGTGDITYSLRDEGFSLIGYELTENEGGKVTTTFDGNTVYASKFTPQNVITSAYTEAVAGGHAVTGMTPENGKLGFYGSADNTMISFNKPYADFVLQFDYISIPHGKRGTLTGIEAGANGIVYSPLYIQFGMEGPITPLLQTYALGIVEGNGTYYQWGAESLINPEGKLRAEGADTKAMAGMKKASDDYEGKIPVYQTKGENGKYQIDYYGEPDPTATTPSFYNKTTRFKCVVINNHVALYAAEVGTDGTLAGDYEKVFEHKVSNSFGYVGLGGGNPMWCEIDNLAITPIAKEKALELGVNAVPAVDLVADIAVADMDADPEPTQLGKPVLTVDTANAKITWTAIENATDYKVKVGDNEPTTVTGTEFSMSDFTTVGTYKVQVTAQSTSDLYLDSETAEIDYVVAPGMLTAPRPVADTAGKKVTWTAVEHAANYTVTVKFGNETKKTETVTALEFSMAEFEEVGTYNVEVKANPATGDAQHTASIGRVDYTVEAQAIAVEYRLDGGTNHASNPSEFVPGSTMPLLNATKEGHTFAGWFTTETFEESSKVTALTDSVALQGGKIVLYAKFTQNAVTHTITYVLNGGTNSAVNVNVYTEGTAVTLGNATKEGFTFAGWYTTENFEESSKVTEIAATATTDITLYAKFVEGEGGDPEEVTFAIHYELDGGTNSAANPPAVLKDATVTLSPATKTGYTFEGWYTTATFEESSKITSVTGTAEITVYAKFTKDAQVFTVTYVLDGGVNASANPTQVAEGAKITLQSATKEGFTFLGWYTSSDFVASSKVTEITVTGNVTLYAQFRDNSAPVGPGTDPGTTDPGTDKKDDEGCGCGGSVSATMGTAAVLLLCGSAALVVRRRKSVK